MPDPALTMTGLMTAAIAAAVAPESQPTRPRCSCRAVDLPFPTVAYAGTGPWRTYDGVTGRLFTGAQVDLLRVRRTTARVGRELQAERAGARLARRAEAVLS